MSEPELEWVRAVQLATFKLDSFDRRWARSWFTSKNRERVILVAALEDARLGLLHATLAAEADTPQREPPASVALTDAPATRRRGRSVSDLPGAYDDAIRAVRGRHGKMTWEAVAAEIAGSHNITLSDSTLRGWCKADGLPHPGERERLMRA